MGVHYNHDRIRPVLGLSAILRHLMSSGPQALSQPRIHCRWRQHNNVQKDYFFPPPAFFFFLKKKLKIPPATVFGIKNRGFHLKPISCSSGPVPRFFLSIEIKARDKWISQSASWWENECAGRSRAMSGRGGDVQKYALRYWSSAHAELGAAVLTAPQSKKVYPSFLGTVEPIHCRLSRSIISILRNHIFFFFYTRAILQDAWGTFDDY